MLVQSPICIHGWARAQAMMEYIAYVKSILFGCNLNHPWLENRPRHKSANIHCILGKSLQQLLAWNEIIWARSRNCGCLVACFCYQVIAKTGNKTVAVSWPGPYIHENKFRLMGMVNNHGKTWDSNIQPCHNSTTVSRKLKSGHGWIIYHIKKYMR